MAVKHNDLLTPEQLENSYEYKVVKRMLKKEYPWIIDIIPPSEDKLNEYNLIFLDLVINPYMLQKEMDWPIIYWVMHNLKNFGRYESSYLSVIFDIAYRESEDLVDDMMALAKGVKKSPALPQDLKLPESRNFAVGNFIVTSEVPIPDDVIVTDGRTK